MSEKKNILKPEDNGDEPPDGLNVALPFKRLGIYNPAVTQKDNDYINLGKRVFKFLDVQESNEPEYVKKK